MKRLDDRTKHQPITWRCFNPECAAVGQRCYDFTADSPQCPKCGANPPFVAARALIHMLVKDKSGPIPGDFGVRYKLACEGKRDYLATMTNEEAASGDSRVVNCPGCLSVLGNVAVVNGQSLSIAK